MGSSRIFQSFLVISAIALPAGSVSAAELEKLSLFNVIDLALKNHPEIAVLQARASQARAKSAQAPSIPPPTLSFGATGENGPFASQGRMENAIEVSQTIPFPTKLTSESRARSAEEREVESELKARSLSIVAEAKGQFFDLYRARELLELLRARKQVLNDHVKRVRATPLSDRLAQAHLLRVQTDAILIENEIDRVKPEEIAAQGKLNIAMGREPGSPISALELPKLSELPSNRDVATDHPELQSLRASIEASDAESSRAGAEWLPDFRIQYFSTRRFDGVMPNNSALVVGIDLPFLFFWQPKGKVAEANAKLEESRAMLAKTESGIRLEVLNARAGAEAMRSQLLRFEREILPQSEKRLKIAHGIAPTDMESLDEHRNAIESVIEFKRAALELRVNYEKSVAALQRLVGGEEAGR